MTLFLRTFVLVCLLCFTPLPGVLAAVPKDFAVDLKATVSNTVPHIVLSWTQRVQSNIIAQKLHRRLKGASSWVLQSNLTASQTAYTDTTALPGIEYEYWMERTFTGLFPNTAMGYLSAGVEVPAIENRGTLLLVVDDTMVAPLAPEIALLRQDLAGDGWNSQLISSPRTGTAASTKALIQTAWNADPSNVKAVYLLGHVPVPYSGNQNPDGHSDHNGAWPADAYYGEMNGTWTDSSVNNTAASRSQNDNIPGDGKFDQTSLPSAVELMVGRVDLRNMLKAPASSVSETSLLRRYLGKAHDFRHKLGAYAAIPRRTLIRDGFGHAFSSEPFAVTAWAQAFSSVADSPAAPSITEAPSGQWFSPTYAGGNAYLVGHGCGGGSYESASTLGSSTDFGRKASKVVFTSIFGSYHGDWDADNCLLRAPLAGNATGDSLGLVCFWTGRPNWFMHHMGMGETVGYSTRQSQNGNFSPTYTPGGSSFGGVHSGLMGDPALRLHMVEPPRDLTARYFGGTVSLEWRAATQPGISGYHVYRGTSENGPLTRLTSAVQTSTSFMDTITFTGDQTIFYVVRSVKLESVPGGTYFNLSQGSTRTFRGDAPGLGHPNPSALTVVQSSGTNAVLQWAVSGDGGAGNRIERKTNTGAFTQVTTVAGSTISYTDPGPFTHGNVYHYRVIATGPEGDSLPSEEVSFEAVAGFFEMAATRGKVNKAAGVATHTINRFGGNNGAVSVTCSTSNSSALSGTHYTATSTVLTWPDGDTTPKTFTVPITNTAISQLPRQFKVTLSAPSTGTSITAVNSAVTLIEDPSATLPAPWSQLILGGITDSSRAVAAEGVLGDATIGGSGVAAAATSENGRFLHQPRTGDGLMSVFVPAPTPSQTAGRFALMVRGDTGSGAPMAAAVTSGDSGFGARLASRATTSAQATAQPGTSNAFTTPRWLRLWRVGDSFTAEASTDGVTWTALGGSTVALPANALWGLFHASADQASNGIGDYQLATYSSFNLGPLPIPTIPGSFAVTSTSATSVIMSWTASKFAGGYRIERRTEGGAFTQYGTLPATGVSFSDFFAAADTAYEYRILGTNSTGDSPWATLRATTQPTGSTGTRPSFLTATPGPGADISLQWTDNATDETGFQIERRPLHGGFSLLRNAGINVASIVDAGTLPGVIYEYRIRATFAAGNSSWAPTATATAPGTATGYQQWLQANTLPMDGSGFGNPTADPKGDGLGNLAKYALGLPTATAGPAGRLSHGTILDGASEYLTFTIVRPEPAPAGITYNIEASSDLASWSTDGIVPVSSEVAGGLRTIVVRDGTAIAPDTRRVMRLRVTLP